VQEIYNDDSIFCGYVSRNDCETLLITFAPLNGAGENQKIWGQSLNSEKFNILGLVAKNRSWYPEKSIRRIQEKCKDLLKKYKNIICYGTSAGAYASVKYGHYFQATSILAFSPIFSIRTDEIDVSLDHRFFRFYKDGLTGGSKITPEEIKCPVYIIYDKYYKWDKYNSELIYKLSEKIELINCQFTGHFPILTINSSKKIENIIELCNLRNTFEISKIIHESRKQSAIRIKCLIEYICLNKKRWIDVASSISKKHFERLNANDKSSVNVTLARTYKNQGKLEESLKYYNLATTLSPNNALFIRELASLHLQLDNISQSEISIYRSLSLNLNCCHAWNTLTSIMLRTKKYHSAYDAIKRAIDIHPHQDFYKRLCSIAERLCLFEELLEYAQKGIDLYGTVDFYRFLIKASMHTTLKSDLNNIVENALKLYPDDPFLLASKTS